MIADRTFSFSSLVEFANSKTLSKVYKTRPIDIPERSLSFDELKLFSLKNEDKIVGGLCKFRVAPVRQGLRKCEIPLLVNEKGGVVKNLNNIQVYVEVDETQTVEVEVDEKDGNIFVYVKVMEDRPEADVVEVEEKNAKPSLNLNVSMLPAIKSSQEIMEAEKVLLVSKKDEIKIEYLGWDLVDDSFKRWEAKLKQTVLKNRDLKKDEVKTDDLKKDGLTNKKAIKNELTKNDETKNKKSSKIEHIKKDDSKKAAATNKKVDINEMTNKKEEVNQTKVEKKVEVDSKKVLKVDSQKVEADIENTLETKKQSCKNEADSAATTTDIIVTKEQDKVDTIETNEWMKFEQTYKYVENPWMKQKKTPKYWKRLNRSIIHRVTKP